MIDELRQSALEQLPNLFESLGLDDETVAELMGAVEGVLEDDDGDPYKWDENGRYTFTLATPIRNMKGEEVSEITMRQGRISDLERVKLSTTVALSEIIKVAAKMCGTTPARLGEVTNTDVGPILSRARHFFTASLGT